MGKDVLPDRVFWVVIGFMMVAEASCYIIENGVYTGMVLWWMLMPLAFVIWRDLYRRHNLKFLDSIMPDDMTKDV